MLRLKNALSFYRQFYLEGKKQGTFINNFAFLFSSKIIVLAFGIILTPIISRLYTPEAYGVFAALNSIIVLIGSVASLKLPLLFTLPKKEKQFYSLWHMAFVSSLIISLTSGIIAFSFSQEISDSLNIKIPPIVFATIGAAILIYALTEQFSMWAIREKLFKKQSKISLVVAFFNKCLAVSVGYLSNGWNYGLYMAEYLSKFLYLVMTVPNIYKGLKSSVSSVNYFRSLHMLKKYKASILINISSSGLGSLSSQASVIAITNFFTVQNLGAFSFASSLLYLPLKILGEGTIGPLMLQKASEIMNEKSDIKNRMSNLLYKFYSVFIFTVIGFYLLILFGEVLFVFLFGKEWILAGSLAKIMSVMFFYRLMATPCTSILRVFNAERIALYLQIALLISVGVSYSVGFYFNDFLSAVKIHSITSAIIYCIYMFSTFRIIKFNNMFILALLYIIIPIGFYIIY